MARISRNFDSSPDKKFYDAQREQAARAFLKDNPEIAGRINHTESDLYTAVAIHLSLNTDAQNRNQLVNTLRTALETAQREPLIMPKSEAEPPRRGRTILDSRPDPVKLLEQLYENAVRDAAARPIGNLDAHAQGRLAASYAAIKLVEVAREQRLIPEGAAIVATRAMVQDKRTSQEFPAAHRIPGDLAIELSDGSRQRLTDVFRVPLNRVAIDRDVFSPTDRISRLANVADSWVENAGMKTALAFAANEVASGRIDANAAMREIIEPGYASAIATAQAKLERNFSFAERQMINQAIVDSVSGQPINSVADELKLSASKLEVRAEAMEMINRTLAGYAAHPKLDVEEQNRIGMFVEGVRGNELDIGVSISRNPDDRAPKNSDIFSQPYYRQRGLQAYDDLMEPIVRLSEEALKAIAKAEDTANNPNATDAQIRASFSAVEGYQKAISRSLDALPQKLTTRLENQFDHENIKVPDASVERFTNQVISNVKLPKTIEKFDNASRRIERIEREYVQERRENGPRIIEHQQKMDEQRDIYDNSPRP